LQNILLTKLFCISKYYTNRMRRLPVPCRMILHWSDQMIVSALLRHIETPTDEFLYGKCYPMFKSLYTRYYTGCPELLDFINNIYIIIIYPNDKDNKCKLESFNYRCALHNWVGVVSIRYCYAQYKKSIPFADGDINDPNYVSIYDKETIFEPSMMNSYDIRKIVDLMSNERYRRLIKLRYIQDLSNEETAAVLGITMENYYNLHRRARVQFISAYNKEMERREMRHA